jgi:hypothetical protein
MSWRWEGDDHRAESRCEARAAFRKAMADHLKPFEAGAG